MQNHPEIRLIDNRDNDHVVVWLQPDYCFADGRAVGVFQTDEQLVNALENIRNHVAEQADKALYRSITQE